ncbi:MAG: hypothetical protein ACRDT4_25690 [Micromonosporaceae bacterium]
MAVAYGKRFPMDFDEVFPAGACVVGEVTAVTEYQSPEDKARNRPVRPRIDEATGLPIVKVTIANPSAEKDREKSITVEIAAKVQPVPPAAVNGLPFRPVVLEGLTVQPRAEASGQAKWITWVIRATGMRAVNRGSSKGCDTKPGSAASASADARSVAA